MQAERAIVFANGELPEPEMARQLLRPGDTLIAADGGTRHVLVLGLVPDVVVGDLDSIPDEDRINLAGAGVQFIQHAEEKDQTDLELAIQFAIDQGLHSILIVAGLGGRLDQTLGNIGLLSRRDLSGLSVRMDDGRVEVFFVDRRAEIEGQVGDTVSLIPWGMPAEGVTTAGLKYRLDNESLFPERARGMSNVMTTATAVVSLKAGLLLCVHERKPED